MKVLGYLACVPISIFLGAWCVSSLFNWFIAPLGMPEIGMWHALGISTFISVFKIRGRDFDSEDLSEGQRVHRIIGYWCFLAISVGFGWLWQLMM
jgi:hypothetical protein